MTRPRRLMSHFDLVQYSITALVQYSELVGCSNIALYGQLLHQYCTGALIPNPLLHQRGMGVGGD